MSEVKITTNNHARELFMGSELPKEVVERDFDYLGPYEESNEEMCQLRFFKFRNSWWDAFEFEAIRDVKNPIWKKWHGVQTQSVWDAVVIRYTEDYDAVVVGHATW